ncbi:hypothetical protein R1sor_022112 [Riccia sorocarpa]|uniref:SWIM-type domain-containing protein n=1 Tax=Riccia sorocarpa TaxID=122646 RepID=A0ABD3GKN2_9MARC
MCDGKKFRRHGHLKGCHDDARCLLSSSQRAAAREVCVCEDIAGQNCGDDDRADTGRCSGHPIPPAGSFRSESLIWRANEAWFLLDRLQDFLKGECTRPDVPTSFKVRQTEDPTMDTGKCTRRYWCAYGPTDLRKPVQTTIEDQTRRTTGNQVGKKERPLARKTQLGTSQKRGCQAHFAVYIYSDKPELCCVRWKGRSHVDKAGAVCHGKNDPTAVAVNAHLAPRISTDLRLFIERLLRAHVQPSDIVKEHHRMIRGKRESDSDVDIWTRDMQLVIKDVLNIQAALRRSSQVYSSCDAMSVRMWVQANSDKVFFYQERKPEENQPFICVWLVMVLTAVKEKVETYRADSGLNPSEWRPSCWLVDDAPEEYAALTTVFPNIPVNLCLFHVNRWAWLKNLHAKVKDSFMKAELNRELGRIMYAVDEDPGELSEQFMENNAAEVQFISYYRTHWHPRIGRWAKVYRQYQHSNQESQGAIERWHSTLKTYLRCSRRGKAGRKVFWLLQILTDTLETFFWCASELKRQGRLRNNIVGRLVLAAILKAKSIPDSSVLEQSNVDGKEVAWIRSVSDPSRIHEVVGWNSDKGGCTCGWAVQGNVCKHQIKILLMAGYTEMELLSKLGIKYGTISGGFDNLVHTVDMTEADALNMEILESNDPNEHLDKEHPDSEHREAENLVTASREDFMTEASKIWSAVQHSTNLARHALAFLKDAYSRTADLVAVTECGSPDTAIPEEHKKAEFERSLALTVVCNDAVTG